MVLEGLGLDIDFGIKVRAQILLGMAWRVLVDLSSCSAIFHQKVCKMPILQTLFTDIQNPYPEEILTQLSLKTKKSVIRFVLQTIFLTFKNNKKPLLNPHPNPNPSKKSEPNPNPRPKVKPQLYS